MKTSRFATENVGILAQMEEALPRRQFLQSASLAVLAGLALSACGSAPRKTAAVSRPARGNRAAPRPYAPRPAAEMAVRQPVQLDSFLREEAVARAMTVINTPYHYGGNAVETGFDCSGLVQYVFSGLASRPLPRSAVQWAQASVPIDSSQLQRGDLVFFNTSGASFSHMGIYVGNRQFVHSPSSGKVVSVESMDKNYYLLRFDGARTVFVS